MMKKKTAYFLIDTLQKGISGPYIFTNAEATVQ
jgi:hypothetical protein